MLRNRGLTIRFLFCSIVQPVLITTVVLTLGLFHILNPYIVQLLFWGALIASLKKTWRQYRGKWAEYLALTAILLFGMAFFLTGRFMTSPLAAKIYRWGEDFTETHPAEAQVYYEDDDFVCYVIHQKPEAPLEPA